MDEQRWMSTANTQRIKNETNGEVPARIGQDRYDLSASCSACPYNIPESIVQVTPRYAEERTIFSSIAKNKQAQRTN